MGNIFDIIGSIGGIAGDALGFVGNQITNAQNRKLMREQNEFNANEAQKNRDFQAQEAQIARDWQEQQYNLYSSPQAMVRQYQEAGLNPALMYGQNLQSGTGSSPTASGSAASGSSAVMNAPQFGNIVQNLATLAKIKQDIAESKSREASNYASAGLSRSNIDLNNQNISESRSRISKLIQETRSEELRQGLLVAQRLLAETQSSLNKNQSVSLSYDILEKQFNQEFKDKFGTYPATNLYEIIWNAIKGVTNGKILGIELPW